MGRVNADDNADDELGFRPVSRAEQLGGGGARPKSGSPGNYF